MCFQLPFRYGEPAHQEGEELGHKFVNEIWKCVRILNEKLR